MRTARTLFVVLAALLLGGTASAQAWKTFRSDRFRFEMLIPPGTTWSAKDFGDGWGRIIAKTGAVTFVAVNRKAYFAQPLELQRYAVRATDIPWTHWKEVDKGRGKNGWTGWKTYET